MPLPVKNYPRSKLLPGLPTSMQFYTIAEVAIILETKVGSVHEWIQVGMLPKVCNRYSVTSTLIGGISAT
ncbi:MAG: hypothetical protein NTW32_13845 [Chloroflexi bacterium]|nr:hypothetical protein [Chloroflexota bacterium]